MVNVRTSDLYQQSEVRAIRTANAEVVVSNASARQEYQSMIAKNQQPGFSMGFAIEQANAHLKGIFPWLPTSRISA